MDGAGLPHLTSDGLLPQGVHDCSPEEVEAVFGRFQKSERRCKLMALLRDYLAELRTAGWGAKVILNGSFVMAKVDEPEDIDLILVLPGDWDWGAEIRPFEYNLISRKRVRRKFGVDVFAVPADSDAERGWIEFFQRINVKWLERFGWKPTLQKGIVRIQL